MTICLRLLLVPRKTDTYIHGHIQQAPDRRGEYQVDVVVNSNPVIGSTYPTREKGKEKRKKKTSTAAGKELVRRIQQVSWRMDVLCPRKEMADGCDRGEGMRPGRMAWLFPWKNELNTEIWNDFVNWSSQNGKYHQPLEAKKCRK